MPFKKQNPSRPYKDPDQKPSKNLFIKFLFLFVILGMPLILLQLFFRPLVGQKNIEEFVVKFRLQEDFTKQDLSRILENMQTDQKYSFYFFVLKDFEIVEVVDEVYAVLDEYRDDSRALLNVINEKIGRTRAKGVLFENVEYPEDFAENVDSYPKLKLIMMDFLKSEMELTVLAICFKATYADNFSFDWDQSSYAAAKKLYNLVLQLKQNKKL